MKNARILLLVIGLLSSIALQAQNQQKRGGQNGRMNEMSEKAKTELNLTGEQADQWDAVHVKYGDIIKELRNDDSISQEEKKQKMGSIHDQIDKELDDFLTKEQMAELNAFRSEVKQEYRNSGQKGDRTNGKKYAAELKSELNLSPEQSNKWDEIMVKYGDKKHNLMMDEGISQEDRRPMVKELKGEMNAEIMAILDSNQQAAYKNAMGKRKGKQKQQRSQNSQ